MEGTIGETRKKIHGTEVSKAVLAGRAMEGLRIWRDKLANEKYQRPKETGENVYYAEIVASQPDILKFLVESGVNVDIGDARALTLSGVNVRGFGNRVKFHSLFGEMFPTGYDFSRQGESRGKVTDSGTGDEWASGLRSAKGVFSGLERHRKDALDKITRSDVLNSFEAAIKNTDAYKESQLNKSTIQHKKGVWPFRRK